MATSNLNIQIQAFVNGLQQVQQMGQQMVQLAQQSQQVGTASQQASSNFGAFTGQMDATAAAADKLAGYLKAAAGAFLALVAVKGVKSVADYAASVQLLGVTLGIVGGNAGYTTKEMQQYEDATKAAGITTEAARRAMTGMIQAGLKLGPSSAGAAANIALLATAAQDLAVVTGQNSSDTLTKLITNIQQLDTQGLRYMGIVVNMDEVTTKWAAANGVAAASMTQAQKQQALLNATLEKAGALTGAYEASMDTVGKKLSSLDRFQKTLSENLGNILLPAYKEMVIVLTDVTKGASDMAGELDKSGTVAESLAEVVRKLLAAGKAVFVPLVTLAKELGSALVETASKLKSAFEGVNFGNVGGQLKTIVDAVTEFGVKVIKAVGDAAPYFAALAQQLVGTAEIVTKLFIRFTSVFASMGEGVSITGLLVAALTTLGAGVAIIVDGFTVLQGVLGIALGIATAGLGALTQGLGYVLKGIGFIVPGAGELGDVLVSMGDAAQKASVGLIKAGNATLVDVKEGKTAWNEFKKAQDGVADGADKNAKAIEEQAKAVSKHDAALKEVTEKVRLYTRSVNEGVLTGEAATKAAADLSKTIAEVGKEAKFTDRELAKLTTGVKLSADKAGNLDKAYKDLGLSASTFAKGLSEAGIKGVEAFNSLAQSGTLSSEQLRQAFAKGIEMETSIRGLKTFQQAAEEAFKKGKLSAGDYQSALSSTEHQFESLVEKELKAAKSPADFAKIKADIAELGVKAAESGARVDTLKAAMASIGSVGSFDVGLAATKIEDLGKKGALTAEQVKSMTGELSSMAIKSSLTTEQIEKLNDKLFEVETASKKAGKSSDEIAKLKQEIITAAGATRVTGAQLSAMLETTIQKGSAASVSMASIASALDKVREASTQATAKMLALSAESAKQADNNAKITQAETGIFKQQLDITEQRLKVRNAEAKAISDGTEQSKLMLAAERASLAVAEAKGVLLSLQLDAQVAGQTLITAQSALKNAEDDIGYKNGDAAALRRHKAAQTDVTNAQVALDTAKGSVSAQEGYVSVLERAAAQTDKVAEAQKRVTDQVNGAKAAQANFLHGLAGVYNKIWGAAHGMEKLGYSTREAAEIQKGAIDVASRGAGSLESMFEALGKSLKYVEEKAQSFKDSMLKATEFASKFDDVKNSAEATARAVFDGARNTHYLNVGIEAANEVYKKVAVEARKIADAAIDSVGGFQKATDAIHLELLDAQGRDEEASKLRFAQRQKDLDLEYKILAIKLKAAEITAQAAGLDTADIRAAIQEEKAAYEDAKKELSALEAIKVQQIKKDIADKAAQAKADALKTTTDKAPPAQPDPSYLKYVDTLKNQSAPDTVGPTKATAAAAPANLGAYTLNLNSDKGSVAAKIPADQSGNFMQFLASAQRTF